MLTREEREEKMEKVFTNISRWLLFSGLLLACDSQIPPYEVPYFPFEDIYINLSLPEYQSLQVDGGYYEYHEGTVPVKGVIIYRQSADKYLCYDKYCTWEPNSAGATVSVDNSGLFMTDYSCGSSFSFSNGEPIGGVAIYPLQQYRTYLDGFGGLIITDEIVN